MLARAAATLLAPLLAMALPFAAAVAADGDLMVVKSPHAVAKTIDNLAAAIEKAGAKVVARVDHAAGAKAAGTTLPPTELLIFGNPKLGTPLLQADPRIGLDLPLKALAWQDASGQVWLGVTNPAALKSRYAIKDRDATFDAMDAGLRKLTQAATAP